MSTPAPDHRRLFGGLVERTFYTSIYVGRRA